MSTARATVVMSISHPEQGFDRYGLLKVEATVKTAEGTVVNTAIGGIEVADGFLVDDLDGYRLQKYAVSGATTDDEQAWLSHFRVPEDPADFENALTEYLYKNGSAWFQEDVERAKLVALPGFNEDTGTAPWVCVSSTLSAPLQAGEEGRTLIYRYEQPTPE